uniref:Uncharacterized protein n=1 Tax=Steinernema glaseri TaxID=37863 RepID=A0A1I7YR78_9BILA
MTCQRIYLSLLVSGAVNYPYRCLLTMLKSIPSARDLSPKLPSKLDRRNWNMGRVCAPFHVGESGGLKELSGCVVGSCSRRFGRWHRSTKPEPRAFHWLRLLKATRERYITADKGYRDFCLCGPVEKLPDYQSTNADQTPRSSLSLQDTVLISIAPRLHSPFQTDDPPRPPLLLQNPPISSTSLAASLSLDVSNDNAPAPGDASTRVLYEFCHDDAGRRPLGSAERRRPGRRRHAPHRLQTTYGGVAGARGGELVSADEARPHRRDDGAEREARGVDGVARRAQHDEFVDDARRRRLSRAGAHPVRVGTPDGREAAGAVPAVPRLPRLRELAAEGDEQEREDGFSGGLRDVRVAPRRRRGEARAPGRPLRPRLPADDPPGARALQHQGPEAEADVAADPAAERVRPAGHLAAGHLHAATPRRPHLHAPGAPPAPAGEPAEPGALRHAADHAAGDVAGRRVPAAAAVPARRHDPLHGGAPHRAHLYGRRPLAPLPARRRRSRGRGRERRPRRGGAAAVLYSLRRQPGLHVRRGGDPRDVQGLPGLLAAPHAQQGRLIGGLRRVPGHPPGDAGPRRAPGRAAEQLGARRPADRVREEQDGRRERRSRQLSTERPSLD